MVNSSKIKTPRKAKGYFELKHSQRAERKRKYQSAFQEASNIIHSDVSSIKVQFNFNNGQILSFFPRKVSSHENTALENEGAKNSKDLSVIRQVIAVKDKYRISDEALHELHMIGAVIPSKTVINTEKNRLNTTLEIMSHPYVSSITDLKFLMNISIVSFSYQFCKMLYIINHLILFKFCSLKIGRLQF